MRVRQTDQLCAAFAARRMSRTPYRTAVRVHLGVAVSDRRGCRKRDATPAGAGYLAAPPIYGLTSLADLTISPTPPILGGASRPAVRHFGRVVTRLWDSDCLH